MNMRGQKEGNINEYLADTIAQVFSDVYTVDVAGSTNRELFASDNQEMLSVMSQNITLESHEDLKAMMQNVQVALKPYQAGNRLMTDDQAPVELLGMRVIDDLISEEVAYYRGIYEKEGIDGLIEKLQ